MASFPRTILPFEVTSLDLPGPLISKSQSGRVNIRTTQQVGRSWQERYLVNVRSVDGRALLAAVDDYWRNGTIFTIDHRDHVTPLGTGGGSPLINQPTQLLANPENFAGWSSGGTPILTSGQSDPFGGTAAYKIEDNDAAGFEYIVQTCGYTGDAEKAASVYLRFGNAAFNDLRIRDITAGVDRHRVRLTWTNGVPAMTTIAGSGTRYSIEDSGSNWYRCSFSATGVVAANTNRLELNPVGFDAASDVGFTYFFGAQTWNSVTPAAYIGPSHVTATGSRIYVDGATASVTNWLRAGDILKVAGLSPAYEVTANVNSEAGGYASVPVNPPIFIGGAPADNAAVTITGVTLNACILEPPTYPTSSGSSADYGELAVQFSETL